MYIYVNIYLIIYIYIYIYTYIYICKEKFENGEAGEYLRLCLRGLRTQGLTVRCSRRKSRETENLAFAEATHRALKLGVERVYRN